jgi:hypothetical protein
MAWDRVAVVAFNSVSSSAFDVGYGYLHTQGWGTVLLPLVFFLLPLAVRLTRAPSPPNPPIRRKSKKDPELVRVTSAG